MRCPRCNLLLPDGTSICTNCDEILDASFLADRADEDAPIEGEPTTVGAAPARSEPVRLTARTNRFRGGWSSGRTEAPPDPAAPAVPKGSYLSEAPAPAEVDPLAEARRSVDELGSFFRSLSPGDRWSAGSALVLLVSLVLPWRWTKADDEVIGLVAAWPVAALALAVTARVYWRTRRASARLGRTLLLVQAGAAVVATLVCGWFLRASTDVRTVRAAGRLVSTKLATAEPAAYLGLLCAAAAAIATLATLGSSRRE